jgi:hypothetical protein
LQTQEAPRGTLRVRLAPVGMMMMMPTLAGFMRACSEIAWDVDFSGASISDAVMPPSFVR